MTRILNREFDLEAARRLHEEGYLPPVARALSARGIRDASELAQDWKSMLPPAMLEGTREAAERLALAQRRHDPFGAHHAELGKRRRIERVERLFLE